MSIIEEYTKWHYSNGNWEANRFLGVMCIQNPNDVWIIQELIFKTIPDYVIECGTNHGGSALLWSMLLENTSGGEVITIDIEDRVDEEARRHRLWERVTEVNGDSIAVSDRVATMVRNKRVMVILDSNHSTEHVKAEMASYADVVNIGGYMIVQDTVLNGHPVDVNTGTGPYEAVEDFLASDDRFIVDSDCERMGHTHHPNGYLRKIR